MTTLNLLLDEQWPDSPAADWVLVDARGKVLQQGRSEPRHWPAADRQVAVLAGAQVSLCSVELPKARRQERERLIAYALEERLPAETTGQHFTIIEHQRGRALVAIVDAARLRRLVDTCAAIERPLAAAVGRLQCLPRLAGTAVCVDEGPLRYWRWPDGSGLAEDAPAAGKGAVSWLAEKTLRQAAAESVLGPPGLAAAVGLLQVAESGAPLLWYHSTSVGNLLHGAFAPRAAGGTWSRRWRWPAWIAGAAVALHLAAGVVSVVAARQTEAELNAKTRAIFSTTFPGAAIVDPLLQMRRQLNEVRPRHGQLRDDDLLALAAALADALGGGGREAVAQLRYEEGALEVSLGGPTRGDRIDRSRLIAALAMRGVAAQPVAGAADGTLVLRRSVP